MKSWEGEAEEALRGELLRRGEEITQLARQLEITQQALRIALARNEILEDFIKRIDKLTRPEDGNAH